MSKGAAGRRVNYRRWAFHWLVIGAVGFIAVSAGLVLARRAPEAYVPGTEMETSGEITRTLDRGRPAALAAAAVVADVPGPGAAAAVIPPAGTASTDASLPSAVRFVDTAEAAGLRFAHFGGRRSSQLPEDMGSGLAWGDFDGDGDHDLFVVNEAGPLTMTPAEVAASAAHARLYRNDGGRFNDVTEAAGLAVRGWGMGAAWGDYDGDEDLDLFVTRYGTNLLFRNDGGGPFTDVSDATGVARFEGFWTGASWGDYDRDGDLDLYVCGYVRYERNPATVGQESRQFKSVVPFTLNPSSYPAERNLLLRNDGRGFKEVAKEAGVDNLGGRSLSSSWSDLDGDGWPDIYVANDVSDNAMFHNLGNGTFRDISHSAWVADYRGAMGLGIGDWDNDGDIDIFVTHWIAQENALYANETARMKVTPEAPLRFVDQADVVGLGQIALAVIGWGTSFFDYDNDGRLDLFVANGSTFQDDADPSRLVPMRNFLFWNAGEQGYFEVGRTSGGGFQAPNVGRGSAVADYDVDGDLDVALVAHGGALRLLRNEDGNRRAFSRIVLRSRGGIHSGHEPTRSTTFATGALVRLSAGGITQMREVGGGSSYLSQEAPGEVFFGVGSARRVDVLEVRWPSGLTQAFRDLPTRTTLRLLEGAEAPAVGARP